MDELEQRNAGYRRFGLSPVAPPERDELLQAVGVVLRLKLQFAFEVGQGKPLFRLRL